MPTATRKRGRPRKSELDQELEQQLNPETIPADAGAVLNFNPFDPEVEFFDALRMITDAEWQKFILYLYRLEPRVRNDGEYSYIDKYSSFVDEDRIKNGDGRADSAHGGGKYQLWLKDDFSWKGDVDSSEKPRIRKHSFRIEGDPIYQKGQTILNPQGNPVGVVMPAVPPGAPPTAAAEGNSELTTLREVLKEFREMLTSQSSQSPELMRKSFEAALDITREAGKRDVSSMTGNPMMDTLMVKMFEKVMDGNGNKGLELVISRLDRAIEKMGNPQPSSAAPDPLSQLSIVKDLLGAESIADLIRPAGDGAWKAKLVEAGANLIGVLPQIVQAIMANQERQFQRAREMQAWQRNQAAIAEGQQPGAVPLGTAAGQAPVIPFPAAPLETTTPPSQGPQPIFNPVEALCEDMAIFFERGFDGDVAADFVLAKYGEVLGAFKGMLSNLDQVRLFCQNTQPLAELATSADSKEDFEAFLKAFVAEIVKPEEVPAPA